jgi:hypothetical protein
MSDEKRMVVLLGDVQRQRAKQAIDDAPAGWVVRIVPPAKSRDQEEKYHAMIGDIAKHCVFMGEKLSAEDWKRLLVDAFVRVMREMAKADGKPDPFPGQGRVMPNLDGTGFVQLGVQTRRFSKSIARDFIEYLYAYGCDNLVPWSEPAMEAYQQAMAEPVRARRAA